MSELTNQHTEYRRCHLGGAIYLAIEGCLWLLAAIFGTLGQVPAAMITLLMGGMLIHPMALGLSRIFKLSSPQESNRLPILNTWIALTIPLGLPLVFMAISSGHQNLFFPAFTVLVGAHWLPFAYIYSMKSFLALAGILVSGGILFGFIVINSFMACAFFTGGIHLLFALLHYFLVRLEKMH